MESVQKNKTAYLLTCTVGCLFVLAGCSSDDDSPVVDTTATVSGTIANTSGTPLSGVAIEGVYTTPGDTANAATSTDSTGVFSLTVDTSTTFYVHGAFDSYATLNTEKFEISQSLPGFDIEMPTTTEAQAIIDAAFPTALPQLSNHAWLAVDVYVYDTNDAELGGKTISSSVTPAGFAYIDCAGAPSTRGATDACIDREGVMYLAYFDSTTESTVTVDGIPKTAPLNLGEITALEYEVAYPPPPDEPTAFELGRDYYDANCAGCHAAGSHDTSGLEMYDMGEALIVALNTIAGMGRVSPIDQETLDNLFAFLEDPSIAP